MGKIIPWNKIFGKRKYFDPPLVRSFGKRGRRFPLFNFLDPDPILENPQRI